MVNGLTNLQMGIAPRFCLHRTFSKPFKCYTNGIGNLHLVEYIQIRLNAVWLIFNTWFFPQRPVSEHILFQLSNILYLFSYCYHCDEPFMVISTPSTCKSHFVAIGIPEQPTISWEIWRWIDQIQVFPRITVMTNGDKSIVLKWKIIVRVPRDKG